MLRYTIDRRQKGLNDHEGGSRPFIKKDGSKFMLKLASWPQPPVQCHNDVNFLKIVWKCPLREVANLKLLL